MWASPGEAQAGNLGEPFPTPGSVLANCSSKESGLDASTGVRKRENYLARAPSLPLFCLKPKRTIPSGGWSSPWTPWFHQGDNRPLARPAESSRRSPEGDRGSEAARSLTTKAPDVPGGLGGAPPARISRTRRMTLAQKTLVLVGMLAMMNWRLLASPLDDFWAAAGRAPSPRRLRVPAKAALGLGRPLAVLMVVLGLSVGEAAAICDPGDIAVADGPRVIVVPPTPSETQQVMVHRLPS